MKPEDPNRTPTGYDPENATDTVHMAFAKSREDLDKILGLELLFATMIGALMTLCAVVIVNRLTARAFKQVTALSDAMGEIDMQSLSSRVPDGEFALELQPVAVQINEVLAQLEKGVQREKRFSADIAHELRPPLTVCFERSVK